MQNGIIQSLPELRPDSGVKIPYNILCGINNCFAGNSSQLVRVTANKDGIGTHTELINGVNSLPQKARATRMRQRLPAGAENNLTKLLNDALLGGEQYPFTMMIGGIIAGSITAGAGFLFALAATALSVSRIAKRILARENDEIWQVEEIGKVKAGMLSDRDWDVVYVGSYFLVDPYRRKAWLIHESRSIVQV